MSDLTVTATVGGNGKGEGGSRRDYFVDPKAGMYPAVCVDVIDHGFSKNSFGKVNRKIQFAFQLGTTIDEKMIAAAKKAKGLPTTLDDEDKELIGTRLFVRGKKMALSLFPGGEKMKSSDLYAFLENWNGERFVKPTKDKPLTVDLESYVGRNATLMIVRNPDKNDSSIVYSNITAIMPPEEDAEVLELVEGSYTRVKDRDNFTPPPTEADVTGNGQVTAATDGTPASAPAAAEEDDADVDIPFDQAA
jgi:hypothetical protein